jgi:2-polyprenyl-3-methyl-5-hydroxy-6-metoxy-1,4-benzoquinol methylase
MATFSDRAALLDVWRRALTMDDRTDPFDAIIAELAEYFGLSADEARERCIRWNEFATQEWLQRERDTPEGLRDFFDTQTSWIFDTMWYHAMQHHGEAPAETVEVMLGLPPLPSGRVLDFGAGPGTSAIFFHLLGFEATLADVSASMRDFAAWRLRRRGIAATIIDSGREELPAGAFDLITAFDVMVHVPDAPATLARLSRALKPGGYLVFNIDNQPQTLEHHGHLYRDQWPILRHVRRNGFRRLHKITYFHLYQKVERGPAGARLVAAYDLMRYNRFVTMVGNTARGARSRLKAARPVGA